MEEGGKEEEEMNEMFGWDSCSFSMWGAGGGGGRIEEAATEEEQGMKNAVITGDGDAGRGNGKSMEEEQVPEFHTQTERERRKRMRNMFTTLHGLVPHLPSKADKSTIVEETVNYIRILEHRLQILQNKKDEKLKEFNNGVSFNPFSPSSSSFIPPQHHLNLQQHQMLSFEPLSREALLADHYYFSSSASVTPTNSCPTTPRSNKNVLNSGETAVKLTLSPSSVTFRTFTSQNVVVCVCGREALFSICGARKPGFYSGICLVLDKFQLEVKSLHISSDHQSNLTMIMIQARATALLDRYPVEDIYKAAGAEMLPWFSS